MKKLQIFLESANSEMWKKLEHWSDTIEKIYFHKSVTDITTGAVEIFSAPMYNGSNFFQIGNNYKGGVIIAK